MKKIGFLLAALIVSGCANDVSENSEQASSEIVSTSEASVESEDQLSEEKRISFMGVGDNLIHTGIFEEAQLEDGTYDFKPMFENVANDIEAADLAFINQETLLGGDEFGFSGYPAFNTPSDMAGNLNELGFDLVNGASNHSLDKGEKGVLNTLEIWNEQENMVFTGVFDSQEDRDAIPVIERDGVTFSFLAYTYGTNGIEPDVSYRLNYFDEALITQDIERAKQVSDFVIVSAHWGEEHMLEPNEFQKQYAQLFTDLGVDVVIGTHPHVIQPIEWMEGENGNQTLVVYSLGNFLSAMSTGTENNMLGGMISFDFVLTEEEKAIKNVKWDGIVMHYKGNNTDSTDSRRGFKIYPLADYTEELATQHTLNSAQGNQISKESLQQTTETVIDADFLK
ncbi:poly-gamma-glutamate synthesis protein (capsule biosynthesis protein) [Carnobacterium alterfunditum]|uniref:Poly-gamma-glutamate synthesis protein (Capsule biosynthesis protein) n=1 Tax=Carnobacterium alterfunditum TaxID=28230 RepID=A0A1N6FWX3_9LACT|nr:CapA family protein [Carnobacterium alterfunditum]SIN99758.1 poly-gamma-glutamate synthesis protein (capsule biosynthesis protein) [Carnobacterium alterfunditum]